VRVLFVIVYWLSKSAVAAVLVTSTVPFPVKVPAPETTTAAAGTRFALAFTVKVPPTLKFVLAETSAEVFEIVRELKAVVDDPPII
jgi:hypothetical protein